MSWTGLYNALCAIGAVAVVIVCYLLIRAIFREYSRKCEAQEKELHAVLTLAAASLLDPAIASLEKAGIYWTDYQELKLILPRNFFALPKAWSLDHVFLKARALLTLVKHAESKKRYHGAVNIIATILVKHRRKTVTMVIMAEIGRRNPDLMLDLARDILAR